MQGAPAYEALPQRAPRQGRRAAKRARTEARGAEAPVAMPVDALPAAEASPSGRAPGGPPAGAGPAAGGDTGVEGLQSYQAEVAEGLAMNFEYLDHTADVQLHAWGATLEEAFQNCALAMFNYMTPLSGIARGPERRSYRMEAHDLKSLLFAYLDELLFTFSTEMFVPKAVTISKLDRAGWKIEAEGVGELFEQGRHRQGTEVKAITYSMMEVKETEGRAEVWVIVDI